MAIVSGIALPLAIGLGGAEMVAGGATALFALDTWQTGLGSTLGGSALIGIPGAIVLARALAAVSPSSPALLVGAALLLGSFLVTGHAATAPPAWLMALVVGIHLVAVAFWFAALAPLRLAVRREAAETAGKLLVDFSSRAIWAVALLVLTGIVITWVQVRAPAALIETTYGLRLVAKIILVAAILSLAVYNKKRLTDRLVSSPESGAASLRKTIGAEYWLMIGIMALAVTLTLPSPPRALVAVNAMTASASEAVVVEASSGPVHAKLEVTPARVGENMLMLSVSDANGDALELLRVRFFLSLPAASLDGIEKESEAMAPGMYHLMVNETIIPGDWEVRIDAYVNDFDKRILRMTVPIR
jgi:copper transport protein